MKRMLILRGIPGSGKSTFIKNNNLSDLTICADDIRNLFSNYTIDLSNNTLQIDQTHNKRVWDLFYNLLQERMINGDTVILDTTCSNSKTLHDFLTLANKYNYEVTIADFICSLEDAIARNKHRDVKNVPENIIRNMHAAIEKMRIESLLKNVKHINIENPTKQYNLSELFGSISIPDLSNYKKINHIGDLHGCFSPLQEIIPEIKEDEFYIFLGDYCDRGLQNAHVFHFLQSIMDKPNVVLLEGNHERHLRDYAINGSAINKAVEFNENTLSDFIKADITKEECHTLYQHCKLFFTYHYQEKTVFVSHAGLSFMPNINDFYYMSGALFTKGAGAYKDMKTVADLFTTQADKNTYQIFGHRNIDLIQSHVSEKCFCLCDDIEYGGYLRTLALDENGFHEQYIKNNIHKLSHDIPTIRDLINFLRNNLYIREKQFDGNISSFNFTREAFWNGIWNEQTMIARGLYINTQSNKIVARGYDKFFAIGEREETSLDTLQETLCFPIKASIKYNGFLGLVGYDVLSDRLIVTSKSDLTGDYAKNFEKILFSNPNRKEQLIELLKDGNHTFTFECIDPVNDPHIIKEQYPHVQLLDMIRNKIVFQKEDYKTLKTVAKQLDVPVREQTYIIKDMKELKSFLYKTSQQNYKYKNKEIEGYVLEDKNGYMLKVKTGYYNFWKKNRSILNRIFSGKELDLSNMDDTQKDFAIFCKDAFEKGKISSEMNIITVRDIYLSQQNKQYNCYISLDNENIDYDDI